MERLDETVPLSNSSISCRQSLSLYMHLIWHHCNAEYIDTVNQCPEINFRDVEFAICNLSDAVFAVDYSWGGGGVRGTSVLNA